jgi:elongator complex protein 2
MILDAAWAPGEGKVFATAGREKTVKIWARDEAGFTCRTTITEEHPVTAVDFMDAFMGDGKAYLAVGTEIGRLRIYAVDFKGDFSATEIEVAYSRYVHLLSPS